MATGSFNDLGYSGGNTNEVALIPLFESLQGWDVTSVTPFTIDFGAADVLTVGEVTTITFTINFEDDQGDAVSGDIVITGTYLGHDDTGSPHIDPTAVEANVSGTVDVIPIDATLAAIIIAADDMRVTNDPDFPQDNVGDYPPILEESLPLCFAAGTMIATPQGDRAVETLRMGDMIATADGRSVPVKWIGRQTLHKRFAGVRACPARVSAGAMGEGLPYRDLVLTADHALVLDGMAINAGALVNGVSITLDPPESLAERVTYYHVETEAHDVILANGVPAETFIDYVARSHFDNYAEYVALFGVPDPIAEMPMLRISAARLVPPSIRARLAPPRAA